MITTAKASLNEPTVSRLSGKTQVIGLFGSPISHSRSPIMQNTVFEAMDLDYAYLAFDVGEKHIAEAVSAIRLLNMRGANITMPLKRLVMPYLDELSPAAKLAGAVNVVVNNNGVLSGHITDGEGFILSLQEAGVEYEDRSMVVLGAGGAAIAITVQAALEGVGSVTLFNRRDAFYDDAAAMVQNLRSRVPCNVDLFDLDDHDTLANHIASADILINGTPIGMEETLDQMALPDPNLLHDKLVACDVIYVPSDTLFLKEAAKRGCKTVTGLGMQLHQAAPAFEMWTGKRMNLAVAKRALLGELDI